MKQNRIAYINGNRRRVDRKVCFGVWGFDADVRVPENFENGHVFILYTEVLRDYNKQR